jgi:uncharacterized cupin superfamily protein
MDIAGGTLVIEEARIEETSTGVRKVSGDGWFVIHASEAPLHSSERFGEAWDFEGETQFDQVGIHLHVVAPGQPACLYHREEAQEDFLVLSGECKVLIEEQERSLKAGHFVHCPPGTNHVFVGAGEGPCTILMIGHRAPDKKIVYPVSELAARYGASVETEATTPREAYGEDPVFKEQDRPRPWPLS